jgi:hypothetical protein
MPHVAPTPTARLLGLACEEGSVERLAAELAREPALLALVLQAARRLFREDGVPRTLQETALAFGDAALRDVVFAVLFTEICHERGLDPERSAAKLPVAAFARAIGAQLGIDVHEAVDASLNPSDAPHAAVLLDAFASELAAWATGGALRAPRDSSAAAALGLTSIDIERLLLLRSRVRQLVRCWAS